jgi:methionyl-tRNA formyltransferase
MNIVYMGTPEFAVAPLQALADGGHRIVGVVTVPDKPAGRGRRLQASAVKTVALQHGWPLAQPERLRDERFLQQLREWNADVFVVVAFRMLPEAVFTLPPHGTLNLHASLLPQYRGAAPINRAIMNGEKTTGVTTFFIDRQMDTGRLLFSEATAIGDDENAGQLHDRLTVLGARLVLKTVDALAEGSVQAVAQPVVPGERLHEAPKITKETRRIDWQQSAETIYNQIRGLAPAPAATAELRHCDTLHAIPLKILAARYETVPHRLLPGTLVVENKHTLKVACRDGWVVISRLQPAGKQAMSDREFLAGFREAEKYSIV